MNAEGNICFPVCDNSRHEHEGTQNANISVGTDGGRAELRNRNLVHCKSQI